MIYKDLSRLICVTALMCSVSIIPSAAHALRYDIGRVGLKLTGYGTAGKLGADF